MSDGPQGVDRSLLAHVLERVDHDGWAVEFGVGNGVTLRMIAETLPVIGFDSFKGLPEDWRPGFAKGALAFDAPTGVPNVTLVPGWFEDTVPNYDWPERLSLVHFDADLYSSTMTCLKAIGPYLKPGCFIVFDEFFGYSDDVSGEIPGEQRAWREYAEQSGIVWDVIGHGREQWALRVGQA